MTNASSALLCAMTCVYNSMIKSKELKLENKVSKIWLFIHGDNLKLGRAFDIMQPKLFKCVNKIKMAIETSDDFQVKVI